MSSELCDSSEIGCSVEVPVVLVSLGVLSMDTAKNNEGDTNKDNAVNNVIAFFIILPSNNLKYSSIIAPKNVINETLFIIFYSKKEIVLTFY
ncbi:hypothetical protein [Vagococcus proximus]|uniref:hypothetical protein n=1 Tax=Vagococcus proximus TaxID=2991417 RepID=UPI0023B78323|nr:hypothetical protein [Vagococcus proximus]